MEERIKFIIAMKENKIPFKQLCKEFNISEKTGYKWKNRFEGTGDFSSLQDQSKAPKSNANQLDEDTIIAILSLKEKHPFWGAKKFQAILQTTKTLDKAPSVSSINRILKKAGKIKKRRIRKISTDSASVLRRHIPADLPNDVWAIDFKGWWFSEGEKGEPFTVRDLASKKVLAATLVKKKDTLTVKLILTELFKLYGLPKVIRSDNGTPFCSTSSLLGLTQLSAWWMSLGIIPDRTDLGCPGHNGSLERFHADIAQEMEGRTPGGIIGNQKALDQWREEYNSIRPNEAIGLKTPDSIYIKSPRLYTGDVEDLEYPFGYQRRKVNKEGAFKWKSTSIALSSALRGYPIGLKELGDGRYHVYFTEQLIGTFYPKLVYFEPLDKVQSD